ncbi:G-type lectin S-receptor-like serine/threonine-protein kinase SD2-5 isoform X2 [Selaginella moellendorffii]|nr:G-type lectin S-receptor-like serine/threonine-protein kinase SD2-5 isoform X2 [Selaginella moellendorffii]|eukprot:XP_024517382.1 G-type lectin S-receptor-like serine/threonine-protein kinase SD2-5 isoform X2 [Selaginella moellendorffii]
MTGFFSGVYNLGFVNSTPDRYTLAVLMNVDSGFPTTQRIIWEANREDPVGLNATLSLASDGDLVLRDRDGRLVWSTGTANRGATRVEVVRETGNLVVFRNNTILWQSFDRPTDTLMAGQVLRPGMRLQSRRSRTDPSPGFYSLVMEPGGLVLYSNFSGTRQEPYWIRGYHGVDTLTAARQACDSLAAAVLNGDGLNLVLNMMLSNDTAPSGTRSQALCGLNATGGLLLTRSSANTPRNQSFIRLEFDGDLHAYTLESLLVWSDSYNLLARNDSCLLPQRCQPFGICSSSACVGCLNSDGTTAGWTDTCSAPAVESCSDIESLEFVPVPGVEHFSSKYVNGSQVTIDECRGRCLRNCSCSAFFFWEESNSCFTVDNTGTLQRVSTQSHVGYIKATRIAGTTSSKLSAGVIAGIVVSVLGTLLLVVLVFLWIRRRRTSIKAAVDYDSDNFLESIENLRPMRFSLSALGRITGNFSKLLGTGGFGGVYEGTLPDGRTVAVKKLEGTGQGKKEFYAEVAVLGSLHHWNLVKLLGFCSEGSNRLLVYEHMTNGSLDKWIYQDSEKNLMVLGWKQRIEIVLGMARGLAYLHEECMQRIIHLDIKPQNILLDKSFVAKVADFGLSRLMSRDQSYVMTTMRGTPGYLAPEWLLEASITEKSDVYSFGVVLLEVISGRKCFSRVSETEKFYLPSFCLELVQQGRDMDVVDPRISSQADEGEVVRAIRIAFLCLQENASARPSMGSVVQMLEGSSTVDSKVPVEGLFFASKGELRLDLNSGSSSSTATSKNFFLDTDTVSAR